MPIQSDSTTPTDAPSPLLGIFVGGKSTRMGGEPKGLLEAPDTGEPLAARLARLGREAGMGVVLVGEASAYGALGLEAIADDPAIDGPLGGLSALLARAGDRPAIAVACDMPQVSVGALRALIEAPAGPTILAARRGPDAPWEPLFARYDPARALPALRAAAAEGVRSFQKLFARVGAEALAPSEVVEAALVDWDTPEDR